MKVLIACEESQAITKEFRILGHEAYSCDILECSGGHPEWHIKADCENAIESCLWDLIIFHPPCTAMAVSGNRWYGNGQPRNMERIKAIEWTLRIWDKIKRQSKMAAMENPVSVLFSQTGIDNVQYIQPWMFGHGETKKTGFELWGLPQLKPTNIVEGREPRIWKMPPSDERSKLRSKTYSGIAKAIAIQWGVF